MSKSTTTIRNTAQVQGVKLAPVVCANDDAVFEAAFDGVRRRPITAINAEGVQVVCCSRTAKKHGWTIVERLFQRSTAKVAPVAPAPVAPKKAPAKKAQTSASRKADLAAVEAMLGK